MEDMGVINLSLAYYHKKYYSEIDNQYTYLLKKIVYYESNKLKKKFFLLIYCAIHIYLK